MDLKTEQVGKESMSCVEALFSDDKRSLSARREKRRGVERPENTRIASELIIPVIRYKTAETRTGISFSYKKCNISWRAS